MSTANEVQSLLPELKKTVHQLTKEFAQIPAERIKVLNQLAAYVTFKTGEGQNVVLNFICTHNSRRSHIAQIWAQTAAYFYGVDSVACFSGGTEATAFNVRAVKAMKAVGFSIVKINEGDNPVYSVMFSETAPPLKVFSKRYDHPANQANDFGAIMTCGHADENCPFIPGASFRLPVTYDDPKDFDETPHEEAKYLERVQQIGREMLYAFSQVK